MECLNIKYVNVERKKQNMLKSTLATSETELMNLKTKMNKLTKIQFRKKTTGKYENNLKHWR